MLDEHDLSQWNDIVHFEHKLSHDFDLCFPKMPHTNRESILCCTPPLNRGSTPLES